MSKISHMLTDKIMIWGRYESDYRQEIGYAVSMLLWDGVTLIFSLLTVSALGGEIILALVFAFCFAFLRQFSGGVHAQTHIYCLLSTVAVFISGLVMLKTLSPSFLFSLSIFSGVGIWIVSPIENEKKRLTISQRRWNRGISHKVLVAEFSLSFLCLFIDYNLTFVIQISIIMVFLLQIISVNTNNNSRKDEMMIFSFLSKTRSKISRVFLMLCLCICAMAMNDASGAWNYQEELPDDLRRKIENR